MSLYDRIGDNVETFVLGNRFEGALDHAVKLYWQVMSTPYDPAATYR